MLVIISAFRAEVMPIINAYCLAGPENTGEFLIFSGRGLNIGISGMGYDRAEKLTSHFYAGFAENECNDMKWLNFGIGGSNTWPIDTLVSAGRVVLQKTKESWRLGPNIPGISESGTICTVDSPCGRYDDGTVFEMEAAGMVSCLYSKGIRRNVFVVKQISDSADAPWQRLNRKSIQKLIMNNEDKILKFVDNLMRLDVN